MRQQDTLWDVPERLWQEVERSRKEARELARRRRRERRQARLYPALWLISIFLWLYLCLWWAVGH